MAATNPSSPYKLQSLVVMLSRYRVASGNPTTYKLGRAASFDQGLRFLCVTSDKSCNQFLKMEMDKNCESETVQSPLPAPPPKFGIFNWMCLFLGSISTLLLPLKMLTLEGKAEKIVEEVEVAAVVVEKVATTADKVFSEVAKRLPDDSKLKEVAQAMEHASSLAAHDAQLVEDIIHKVGDVKQDLEELDTMVEKIVHELIHPKPN